MTASGATLPLALAYNAVSWRLVVGGLAYFFQRRFDQALAKLLLAIQENPGSPATYRILAAC